MKKIIALLVALMLVLVSVAALAETTSLKAGTSPDFPPFESLDDAGNVIGFDADLAAAIGKIIGMDIVFEATSFDSIVTGVQTGRTTWASPASTLPKSALPTSILPSLTCRIAKAPSSRWIATSPTMQA